MGGCVIFIHAWVLLETLSYELLVAVSSVCVCVLLLNKTVYSVWYEVVVHLLPLSLPVCVCVCVCVCVGAVSGLNEEDMGASLATMQALASACGADMSVLRERQAEEGHTADCLVRRRVEEDDFMEVRYTTHVHEAVVVPFTWTCCAGVFTSQVKALRCQSQWIICGMYTIERLMPPEIQLCLP